MYFVNDGLFTSFLRNLFDFPLVPPHALKEVCAVALLETPTLIKVLGKFLKEKRRKKEKRKGKGKEERKGEREEKRRGEKKDKVVKVTV